MKRLNISLGSRIIQLALGAFAASIVLLPLPGAANDLNVHPASCVAPFLNQAFPMRWHENYLMNPANNRPTWVICPLNFDNDTSPITVGTSFIVEVIGRDMPGAEDTLPQCYFTLHSAFNLLLNPYADGASLIATDPLTTETLVIEDATLWVAGGSGQRPRPATGNENFELVSVFCRLPAGYAISGIVLSDDIESE